LIKTSCFFFYLLQYGAKISFSNPIDLAIVKDKKSLNGAYHSTFLKKTLKSHLLVQEVLQMFSFAKSAKLTSDFFSFSLKFPLPFAQLLSFVLVVGLRQHFESSYILLKYD